MKCKHGDNMNDLISRKILLKNIKNRTYIDKPLQEIFETVIDEIPTAFDLKKVMQQLEEWKDREEEMRNYKGMYMLVNVIDIVKNGEVKNNE